MDKPRKPTARSSLNSHAFPSFYACYLLKSVRTPLSKATYIGSTPCPPRRIRQHNGEISQGAWKTSRNRPWVMQMIVHGFPSKLAALQFEWAWQHPHLSRHLKDGDGKAMFTSDRKTKYMNTNVQTARVMISSHPYNTWPLHVKFFTQEAEKCWSNVSKIGSVTMLPLAFGYTVELEGVDGKSGLRGSGRLGPITVSDEQFTSRYLAKSSALLASNLSMICTVCSKSILNYASDALTTALCPESSCTAVSHLLCLSTEFLADAPPDVMIPRGGTCRTCSTFVLWGDIIRGCYRRYLGGAVCEHEEHEDEDVGGEVFGSDDESPLCTAAAMGPLDNLKHKLTMVRGVRNSPVKKRTRKDESEGEQFDFESIDHMDTTEESDGPSTPKRGRPRIQRAKRPASTKAKVKKAVSAKIPTTPLLRDNEEHFDFDQVDAMMFTDEDDITNAPIQSLHRTQTNTAGPSRIKTAVLDRRQIHNNAVPTPNCLRKDLAPSKLKLDDSDEDPTTDWEQELRQVAGKIRPFPYTHSVARADPRARLTHKNHGEVDFFDLTGDIISPTDEDDGLTLSRALSVLSVSSPAHSPVRNLHNEDQVIELSD